MRRTTSRLTRARGDEAHHLALDQGLGATALAGLGRILDLLADRHLEAAADEPRQVRLVAVHGHAAHRDIGAIVAPALGQGDVERRRRLDRIVEEQLVKIAHPVKQEMLRVGPLDLQVLDHHRRGRCGRRCRRRFAGGCVGRRSHGGAIKR
jgi:hypothetical protein